MTAQPEGFPSPFGHDFLRVVSGGTNDAYFGLNALSGLITGMAEYCQEVKKGYRSLGPALLGTFMWLNDDELIQAITDFPFACVVVSKQPAATDKRRRNQQSTFDKLRRACDTEIGFPTRACPELRDLAPRENGRPLVIGPYTEVPELVVPAFRSIGPRRTGNHLVPILHTKMMLLGYLWWHDEGPLGHVEDVIGFTAEKLWLGSANGTRSSRSNLELGVWLTDEALLATARRFLTTVIEHSEDIDPVNDLFEPELAGVEFDDDAMAEADLWSDEAASDADDYLP